MPLNSSIHPKTRTVAKVALTLPITHTAPRRMNRIPRARNHPQELRISSIPAASGLDPNCLADILFLLFCKLILSSIIPAKHMDPGLIHFTHVLRAQTLPSNPFTNKQRTISKLCAGCFCRCQEAHSISIHQRHFTEFESNGRRMNLHLHPQLRKTLRVDTPTHS